MRVQKIEYCGIEAGKNLRRNLTETICSSISVAIALLILGILSLYFMIIDKNSVNGLGLTAVPNYLKFKVISKIMGTVCDVLMPVISLFFVIGEMRVVINSKHKEIQLMKLVGAEDSFIYYIYIMEGLVIGIAGAVLAAISLFLISKGLIVIRRTFFSQLTLSLPMPYEVIKNITGEFFILGIIIGIAGSAIALRRTLRKII